MKYTIDKLSDLQIIKVTVSGTLNPFTGKNILLNAASDLNVNNYFRLLLDVRKSILSQHHTTGDSIEIVNYMNGLKINENTKVAYLNEEGEISHKIFVKFAQIIGDVNMKHFTSPEDAIEWLNKE